MQDHPPYVHQDSGPYAPRLLTGVWTDSRRGGRAVPYKIYLPGEAPGPIPVVLWSHGLGGGRDGAGFLSRFLASHGFASVHVQHAGSDTGLWEGKPGHPWDVIRAARIPRSATLARLKDIPFAIDCLHAPSGFHPELSGRLDLGRLGMSGHSFGAMTAQVLAGQARGAGRRLYRYADPRIRAAIAYSVTPDFRRRDPPESIYGGISVPMFHMTGTADESPTGAFPLERRFEVFAHSGGPEQHLLVLEDGDHMVFAGSRGKLKDNPRRAAHERIIRVASLAFWRAYLLEDADARNWLANGGFAAWLDGQARHEYRR